MNYQQFLFYNLTQVVDTKHPVMCMPDVEAWLKIGIYHNEFVKQDDRYDLTEYEAIEQFLKNYE